MPFIVWFIYRLIVVTRNIIHQCGSSFVSLLSSQSRDASEALLHEAGHVCEGEQWLPTQSGVSGRV
jgi:hypothetical protein